MKRPSGRRLAGATREAVPSPNGGRPAPRVRDPVQIAIDGIQDIVTARQSGRALAQELGFSNGSLTLIATIISELSRNILTYAQRGVIVLDVFERNGRRGIVVEARDQGPGIADVARALEIGYSTSGGLGLGLPGVRRLMDEFEIVSDVGMGTMVRARKWMS